MTPTDTLWTPTPETIARANTTALRELFGLPDDAALHRWSVEHCERYWHAMICRLGIVFRRSGERVLMAVDAEHPHWLPGAEMNIVDSCLAAGDDVVAIVESSDGVTSRPTTYGSLRRVVANIARALGRRGITPSDAVAIVMPMNATAVAAYLGVIACGAAVVSVADSFAPAEIATRLRIAGAKLVLTQHATPWGDKHLPLYDKVVAAGDWPAVVRFVGEKSPLRAGDQDWDEFLSDENGSRRNDLQTPHVAATVARSPQDVINILFSSGTTGDPKAIPWDHTTPIKCAADAHLHQDVRPGDVLCWPTSLGWMMGPWLIFAGLINRATIALYAQSPLDKGFGSFVQNAGVTMLGLVPSLVRAWRQTGCMEGLDWSAVRVFSSSGECSSADDMAYLSALGGGKPIIEYCGGTEIGGAYVSSTVTAPNVAAAFSTPAFGCDIEITEGEAFLVGPSMGFSTRLLNRDHHAVYFEDTPTKNGRRLRRHGDELQRLPNGYYRATGRCDDTMNLGGIKVGCTEIERVCNAVQGVSETAAIAIHPEGGGPSKLAVYVILKPGASVTADDLKPKLQQAIRTGLNPLFRVDDVLIVSSFPRTASNKVMRRTLRDAHGSF